MTVHGIDVSEHQGAHIDWKKVRGRTRLRNRNRFVSMKVNEGDRLDPVLSKPRVRDAKAAGLIVGGYDFVWPKPGRTGAQEFDIFRDRAKVVGLLEPGCLRPAIDIEVTLLDPHGTRRYVKSWIDQCVARLGVVPLVYTGDWFWHPHVAPLGKTDADEDLHGAKLWMAAYPAHRDGTQYVPDHWQGYVVANTPETWDHTSFWQYTSQATVPGIERPCDRNKYLSSLKNLKRGHTI